MKYIILNRIKVQNANTIAGLTWGFPSITHFLGFSHNLERKICSNSNLPSIPFKGCCVISHDQDTHIFGGYDKAFTQYRSQPCLEGTESSKRSKSPAIIEEGKMNMTVSLAIGIEGNVGNRKGELLEFLRNCIFTQKLAGGTILDIADIDIISESKDVKRRLMPGFALMDRHQYLKQHFNNLQKKHPDADLLDAWLDFSTLKQSARPAHNLVSGYLAKQSPDLVELWESHLEQKPYRSNSIPEEITTHFSTVTDETKSTKKLLTQWQKYREPDSKSPSTWEYLPKPFPGFLVPIMTGYKAISKVYDSKEVANTRDNETPVCFVEAAHSVGEWISPHRIANIEDMLWNYQHTENWYICKQNT